jgi:NADH-quinone oxidoreductase subunit L
MRIPLAVLALFSLWFVVDLSPIGYGAWNITTHPGLVAFSSAWVIAGVVVAWYYYRRQTLPVALSNVFTHGLYLEHLNGRIGQLIVSIGNITYYMDQKIIDKSLHGIVYVQVAISFFISWVDKIFVDGLVKMAATIVGAAGRLTKSFQGGNIQLYIFWSVFGLIIFLFFMFK